MAGDLNRRPQSRLDRASARLQALSPLAVLNRGYAILYLERGTEPPTILRDAAAASPEQKVRARLARGSVRAVITEIDTETQAQ